MVAAAAVLVAALVAGVAYVVAERGTDDEATTELGAGLISEGTAGSADAGDDAVDALTDDGERGGLDGADEPGGAGDLFDELPGDLDELIPPGLLDDLPDDLTELLPDELDGLVPDDLLDDLPGQLGDPFDRFEGLTGALVAVDDLDGEWTITRDGLRAGTGREGLEIAQVIELDGPDGTVELVARTGVEAPEGVTQRIGGREVEVITVDGHPVAAWTEDGVTVEVSGVTLDDVEDLAPVVEAVEVRP